VNEKAIAGYRTIRSLNERPGSHTILVSDARSTMNDGTAELRAVKRFSGDVAVSSILREIDCAVTAQGEFVCALDDVVAASDGSPAIVFSWQTAGTLRRLLRERESLRPGEAITILAALSAGISRVHRTGIALGSITVDRIHFDAAGCPFFSEWEDARHRADAPTPTKIQHDPVFLADRSQLAAVALSVLAAVSAERQDEHCMAELKVWLDDPHEHAAADWELEWERRLFSIGAPEPVSFTPEPESNLREVPLARVGRTLGPAGASNEARSEWGAFFALPVGIEHSVDEILCRLRRLGARCNVSVRQWCAPVRKRTWSVAAAGLIALVLAAALALAVEDDPNEGAGSLTETSSSSVADESVDSSAAGGLSQNEHSKQQASGSSVVRNGDLSAEPDEALQTLIATRARCIRDLSIECLEVVSQPNSPAFDADAKLIAAVLEGQELDPTSLFELSSAQQVQTLGNSVLFEFEAAEGISKPASLLLVKGEAGWRIRSYTLPE